MITCVLGPGSGQFVTWWVPILLYYPHYFFCSFLFEITTFNWAVWIFHKKILQICKFFATRQFITQQLDKNIRKVILRHLIGFRFCATGVETAIANEWPGSVVKYKQDHFSVNLQHEQGLFKSNPLDESIRPRSEVAVGPLEFIFLRNYFHCSCRF